MKLYHALPQKYLDIQLDELGFTIKHPLFQLHGDITPALWATKVHTGVIEQVLITHGEMKMLLLLK